MVRALGGPCGRPRGGPRGGPWRRLARFALGLLLVLPPSQILAETQALDRPAQACEADAVADALAALSNEGDLVLGSGGKVKLAAIRLPHAGPFRELAMAWLRRKIGAPVLVQGTGAPDRWGRRLVRLRLSDPADPLDFGRGLVDAGLALADPGTADGPCSDDFPAREAAARQRSLGLWADGVYKPIGADEADRLKERTGSFVIVEGRVRTVGERAQVTYLNFGGQWAEDFTVVIPKKSWKRMADRGIDAAAFKGRLVRVRGILEAWQGASITVEIPEMIERLPR